MTILNDIMDINLFENYLKTKALSESSVRNYKIVISTFLKGCPDINNIESYINFLIEKKDKSVYHYYYALIYYIKFKITDKSKQNELLKLLKEHKQKKKDTKTIRKQLTQKQIDDVINHLSNKRHQIIAMLQRTCGLRYVDTVNIKLSNIKEEEHKGKKVIKIMLTTKGEGHRETYIFEPNFQKVFMDYIKEQTPKNDCILFKEIKNGKVIEDDIYPFLPETIYTSRRNLTHENIRKIYYYKYWTDLKQALINSNINKDDWSTHSFRRDFAMRCWELFDKDIARLKEALGHKDMNTTYLYIKSNFENEDTLEKMQA